MYVCNVHKYICNVNIVGGFGGFNMNDINKFYIVSSKY